MAAMMPSAMPSVTWTAVAAVGLKKPLYFAGLWLAVTQMPRIALQVAHRIGKRRRRHKLRVRYALMPFAASTAADSFANSTPLLRLSCAMATESLALAGLNQVICKTLRRFF